MEGGDSGFTEAECRRYLSDTQLVAFEPVEQPDDLLLLLGEALQSFVDALSLFRSERIVLVFRQSQRLFLQILRGILVPDGKEDFLPAPVACVCGKAAADAFVVA